MQQHAQQIQSFPTTIKPPPDNGATLPGEHTSVTEMDPQESTSDSKGSDPQLHTYSLDPIATAMHQYPTQAIAALNTVLFERHGYHRMLLHGNPRYCLLHCDAVHTHTHRARTHLGISFVDGNHAS